MTPKPTQEPCVDVEARDNPMDQFTQNVDLWGPLEWFDRMAIAIKNQDRCCVEKNEIGQETWKNIAVSSAFNIGRGKMAEVTRAALSRPQAPTEQDRANAIAPFEIICNRLSGYQTAKDIVWKALSRPPVASGNEAGTVHKTCSCSQAGCKPVNQAVDVEALKLECREAILEKQKERHDPVAVEDTVFDALDYLASRNILRPAEAGDGEAAPQPDRSEMLLAALRRAKQNMIDGFTDVADIDEAIKQAEGGR